MTDLDRRPLYQRLAEQLASDIARNKLRPGEAIPTEAELSVQHEVALGTVRKALDVLANKGLVERMQGAGTFVRRPDFETTMVKFIQVFGSAGDRRMPDGRILSREALAGPPAVTAALGLNNGGRVIRMMRLRIYNRQPVLWEEIWLEEKRFAAVLTMKDTEPPLLYPIYESLCGEIIAKADETITIDLAGQVDGELLGVMTGHPIVVVERLALNYEGCPVEWRVSRGAASDFRYKVEIR